MITIPEQISLCTSLFIQGKKNLKSRITYGIKYTEFFFFFPRFLILNAKTIFQKGSHLYYEQQAVREHNLLEWKQKTVLIKIYFVFLKY